MSDVLDQVAAEGSYQSTQARVPELLAEKAPSPPSMGGLMDLLDRYQHLGWDLKPIGRGDKGSRVKGWPDLQLTPEELRAHLKNGGNLGVRDGHTSNDLVDIDLDCPEALALADLYLPLTGAQFGRASKPRSHRLFVAPGGIFAAFADPLIDKNSMLVEYRSDGRDGGAHLTLIPPSVADGERRVWHSETIEPATVDPVVLARCVAWLAMACLIMRYISEYAARRAGDDFPELLWEANHVLGRTAYRWLGKPAPDEPRRHPKPRRQKTHQELRLEEVVGAIRNHFDWHAWNRIGMAIYAASGGSEEGFIAFDDLSSRSPKYDPHTVRARWNDYRRSPPSRIGIGTLVYVAREHGWTRGAI